MAKHYISVKFQCLFPAPARPANGLPRDPGPAKPEGTVVNMRELKYDGNDF